MLFTSSNCIATNGYFAIGYGAKSISMGGASIAFVHDGLAAASNPAGMAFVEPSSDLGMKFGNAFREGSIDCRGIGACDRVVEDKSNRDLYFVPDSSYNKQLNDKMTIGVSLYGNGGISTNYGKAIFEETVSRINGIVPPPTKEQLGVDLNQVVFAPSFTYRFGDNHTFGLAPLLAAQRFRAHGLELFMPLSTLPGNVTSRGSDWGIGLGVRIGWLYDLHPRIRLGASYASKVYMTKFEKYDGLFANGGEFDIPSSFGFGVAFKLTNKLDFAFDANRILFGDVDALSNPIATAAELGGVVSPDRRLGENNGIGFGWRSIWAFKFGLEYEANEKWTYRAGFNHGQSPVPGKSALINILSPAVAQDHLTFGIGFRPSSDTEWAIAYLHAFENEVTNSATPLGNAKAGISQNTIDINYTSRF